MHFAVSRKGYDTKEVDAYLTKLTKEHRDELDRLQATVDLLKERLAIADAKLKENEGQKKLVVASLLRATEKAEEIERVARERVADEAAQLRSFHLRWNAYFRKLIDVYPIDGQLQSAKEFTERINRLFAEPDLEDKEALEQFRRLQEQYGKEEDAPEPPPATEADEIQRILQDLSL